MTIELDDVGKPRIIMVIKAPGGETMVLLEDRRKGVLDRQCRAIKSFMEEHSNERNIRT